jgi:hypothetical protein
VLACIARPKLFFGEQAAYETPPQT